MDRETRERATKARAHQLWELNGRSHGKHEDYWLQAEREVGDGVRFDQSLPEVTQLPSRHVDGISPFVLRRCAGDAANRVSLPPL